MKKNIENLISEMIACVSDSDQHLVILKRAHKRIDEFDLKISVKKILQWLKTAFKTRENLEAKEFQSQDKQSIKRLEKLFKECPGLKKIFLLNGNSITWHSSISDEEKEEIRAYVDENHIIKLIR